MSDDYIPCAAAGCTKPAVSDLCIEHEDKLAKWESEQQKPEPVISTRELYEYEMKSLKDFIVWWETQHRHFPEHNFPMVMTHSDWLEQYQTWRENNER